MNAPLLMLALATAPAGADEVPESAAWRANRPPVPEPEPPVLPAFERGQLKNGLEVHVTRVPGLPIVSFELVTLGGAALDPEGQAGLTSMMYALLEEGTESLDALAFSDRVADLGARFAASAQRDHGTLAIGGLSRHAEPLLELLAEVARRPRLAGEDFDRARAETLASLERSLASPQGLAFMVFPGLVYGADHPYGHPPSGTPSSVSQLSVEAVRAQHARVFHPSRSALIATGDIDLAEAMRLAEATLGAWQAGDPAPLEIPPVAPGRREHITLVDRPGAAQTMVLFGRPLFERGEPDELPLTLGNEAWGGSFSGRLNMNLREDKGYTYGARSQAVFRRGVGAFLAYAAVQTEHTGASVAEVFAEFQRLRSDPLSSDEIELARAGIVRSLTGQFQSSGAIASAASSLFVYGLDLDYFQTLGPRYAELEPERVRRITERYLEPERMQVLLVGDLAEIRPQLESRDLGPVEVLSPPR